MQPLQKFIIILLGGAILTPAILFSLFSGLNYLFYLLFNLESFESIQHSAVWFIYGLIIVIAIVSVFIILEEQINDYPHKKPHTNSL